MKNLYTTLLVAAFMFLVGTTNSARTQVIDPVDPAGQIDIECSCIPNNFTGTVYDCNNNPVPGETVILMPPDGSQETDITNSKGKFCFARAVSFPQGNGWPPGYYGLTTRCMGKLVYRAGNGNIKVDLSVCCPDPAGPR